LHRLAGETIRQQGGILARMGEKINSCRILVGDAEGMILVGRPRCMGVLYLKKSSRNRM
jgi:hypothetical protein